MKIDDGFRTADPQPEGQFQFLLVAESELDQSVDEVMKDLLRLVAASCPVKVMVFNGWGEDLRSAFERVLRRCAPGGSHKNASWRAEWLFLGVPTYTDWCWVGGDPSKLHFPQVYILPLESEEIILEPQPKWWEW
jgi:hypothetical protein